MKQSLLTSRKSTQHKIPWHSFLFWSISWRTTSETRPSYLCDHVSEKWSRFLLILYLLAVKKHKLRYWNQLSETEIERVYIANTVIQPRLVKGKDESLVSPGCLTNHFRRFVSLHNDLSLRIDAGRLIRGVLWLQMSCLRLFVCMCGSILLCLSQKYYM